LTRNRYENIDGDELYRRLATGGSLVLVDVRTETEFQDCHIAGSMLVPLHELETRIGEVPNSGTPIAVICEKGQRSVSACRLLAEHGFTPLYNVTGGLQTWNGPTRSGTRDGASLQQAIAPSSYLVENFDLLPGGLVLDIAMGSGRNAIYLATRGFDVDGVDIDPSAVADARTRARRMGAPIRAMTGNYENGSMTVPVCAYNVIMVFNYLHRPLFPQIKDGVVPGGVVIYQTFTTEQVRFGRPQNPDYLLRAGELREVFHDWEILRSREIIGPARKDDKMRAVAAIVARKPG